MRDMEIIKTYDTAHQAYKFFWTFHFYDFFPVVHDYWIRIVYFRDCTQKM